MIQRTIMLLGAWLLVTGTASAGGAYLPRAGTADSTGQRAVLVLEGNLTTLMIQSGFSGNASELAWVVPVTGVGAAQQVDLGPPAEVIDGRSIDLFDRLHEQSAPQAVRLVEKRQSFGCASEGQTFVTRTNIAPFDGLSATDAAFFPLDAHVSGNVIDWLGGVSVGSVCRDLATSCTVDEDCGQPTVCQGGFCLNQAENCGNDADCGADLECVQFMCVSLTPTCGDDTDCRAEVTCRNGTCMNLTPTCASDLDCGGSLEVDTCDVDPDCPKGETCSDICVAGSENAGEECTVDGDCGDQQCFLGTCADGQSCGNDGDCGGLRECRAGKCFFDPNDPQRDCATDADCAGLIACLDGYCEHGGHPCDSDADCGGFVECAGHCENLEVACTTDAECDMKCLDHVCQDPTTVPEDQRRVTQRACSRELDCAAADECQTYSVNGSDRTLCENLAPYCSSGQQCDTTCEEHSVGSGTLTCGGPFSELPCTSDGQCSAAIECQQGMCVNSTRTCGADPDCSTTCQLPEPYGLGLICSSDDDCTSGQCTRFGGVSACSRGCGPSDPCPSPTADIEAGFGCVQAGDTNICWPREEAVAPGRCVGLGGRGSDFRCFDGGDCTAATECSNRTPDPSYPLTVDQTAWLDQYVSEGAKFAVAKLRGVAPATGVDLLPPLAIQLGGNVPVFPLRVADGSTFDLDLYVIAHERYQPTNYAARDLLIDRFFDGGDFDAWYAERVEENFAAASEPTFLVEYADVIDRDLVDDVLGRPPSAAQLGADQWFLTKLRARLSPADAPRDVALGATGSQRFVIRAMGSGVASEATLGGFGVLLVIGWGVWRARRRR